jgi:glycosyltransferase involved in cell wall biosynthesis
MRILTLSDVYFPRVNGVSTSMLTFRRDLQALGHSIMLVVPDYPGGTERAASAAGVADDAQIIRVPSRQVPRDPEDRLVSRGRILALTPRLREFAPDVIHIQTPFVAHYAGVELARRLGVPVLETYHTYFEHYLQHYVPALPKALLRLLARRFTLSQCAAVAAVISPSAQMAAALRAYGVTTPIEVLPTGLPPQSFVRGNGARFRLREGIAAQRPLALFVGRLAHEKNIDFLLRMMQRLVARVPDVLLVLAGEGPARARCAALAARLGVAQHVHFVGYMDRTSTLLDCYAAADAFVFASRTETQGLVLLEALAQGTPVVSTAVMGTVDVLADAGGAVVVQEDERAFAAAVAGVLQDPARREELSRRARDDAARWSSMAMARRLLHIYERLAADGALLEDARAAHGRDAAGSQARAARSRVA